MTRKNLIFPWRGYLAIRLDLKKHIRTSTFYLLPYTSKHVWLKCRRRSVNKQKDHKNGIMFIRESYIHIFPVFNLFLLYNMRRAKPWTSLLFFVLEIVIAVLFSPVAFFIWKKKKSSKYTFNTKTRGPGALYRAQEYHCNLVQCFSFNTWKEKREEIWLSTRIYDFAPLTWLK